MLVVNLVSVLADGTSRVVCYVDSILRHVQASDKKLTRVYV